MQILILTGLCESKKRCLWKQHCCHGLSEEGEKKNIESLNIFSSDVPAAGYLREYSTDQRCSVSGAVVKAWSRTVVAAFDQLWFIFATENCIY